MIQLEAHRAAGKSPSTGVPFNFTHKQGMQWSMVAELHI